MHQADYNWIVPFGRKTEPSDLGHAGAGDYSDEVFGLHPDQPGQGWVQLTVEGAHRHQWMSSAQLASTYFAASRYWACFTWPTSSGGNATDNTRLGGMYILSMSQV